MIIKFKSKIETIDGNEYISIPKKMESKHIERYGKFERLRNTVLFSDAINKELEAILEGCKRISGTQKYRVDCLPESFKISRDSFLSDVLLVIN